MVSAMLDLYSGLSEHDIFKGLWMLRTTNPTVKSALSWQAFGDDARAQVFGDA